MMAPHDDITAPLARWTTIKEPGDPGEPVYNMNFPSEKGLQRLSRLFVRGVLRAGDSVPTAQHF
jgi:hypothetical protein